MSRGPIKIPRGARQVLDADEEVPTSPVHAMHAYSAAADR